MSDLESLRLKVVWFDRLDASIRYSGMTAAGAVGAAVMFLPGSLPGRIITAVLLVLLILWGALVVRAAVFLMSLSTRRAHDAAVHHYVNMDDW